MGDRKPWWDEVVDSLNYKTDPHLLTMARDVRQRIATLEAERDEARRERDAAVAQRERYRAILCNLVMDLDDLGRNGWHGIRKLTEAMARSATADEGGAAIEDVETCESCGRAIELVLKREELEQERWKEGPRP